MILNTTKGLREHLRNLKIDHTLTLQLNDNYKCASARATAYTWSKLEGKTVTIRHDTQKKIVTIKLINPQNTQQQ